MPKKHIDSLSLTEIDYAVAVAQGWKAGGNGVFAWHDRGFHKYHVKDYHPTTNQAQCGELIDEFKISVTHSDLSKSWTAYLKDSKSGFQKDSNKSRLVAACKAFLWSKHPDGMIEVNP